MLFDSLPMEGAFEEGRGLRPRQGGETLSALFSEKYR